MHRGAGCRLRLRFGYSERKTVFRGKRGLSTAAAAPPPLKMTDVQGSEWTPLRVGLGVSVAAGGGGEGLGVGGLLLLPVRIKEIKDATNCPVSQGDPENEGHDDGEEIGRASCRERV